jgi:murein DD-endopeptidase MepM/ murein hydrolase activator NlpD
MRSILSPLHLVAALLVAACARPVVYYPTPAGSPTPKAAARKAATPPPAESLETPLLMSVSSSASADVAYLRSRVMLMPVAGATMDRVEDSFSEPRDGGRVHRAIDILAPRGTPVLSADDGQVLRMSTSGLGGIAIFAKDANGRMVYYYAHMDRFHSTMAEGRELSKGDTIGFVGTTGNAPKNTPHLHFQVMRMPADGRYWDGDPINPFSLLIESEKAARSAPQP